MIFLSNYYSLFLLLSFVLLRLCNSLTPYKKGGHHDSTRTYRYVRDCQRKEHGDNTQENIKKQQTRSVYETMYIKYDHKTYDPQTQKEITKHHYGHRTIVENPLKMISVLEPYKAGSCQKNRTSSVLVTSKKHRCAVAINAGFFNPEQNDDDFGRCYGNIISDGRMVQNSHGIQNACFGIKRDGTIVIGYLAEDEVVEKRNPFVQLVCGVGWVLRDGKEYLNESQKAECKDTESTGSLDRFFNVKAARTLIGYDENGHVHLVQFDGKTDESGVNLHEAATYMKSIGIINAINFDGGGSSTYALHSTLVNYPGNNCENSKDTLCARNVSTIICVRDLKKHKSGHIESLTYCCNRNYLIVIGMAVLVGLSLLGNVYMYGFYITYRNRFSLFTGTAQKKEALKSLLDQNGRYSTAEDESDEDEL